MIGVAVTGALLYLRLAVAAPDADPAWLAPAGESASEGVFQVDFRPRYPDLATAATIRERDLALLRAEVPTMSPEERSRAADAVRERLTAVRTWERDLGRGSEGGRGRGRDVGADGSPRGGAHDVALSGRDRPADGVHLSLEAALHAADTRHLLALEASTLELQLGLLDGGAPKRPAAFDRVAVADDVVVGEGERVRDAVAVGGDVVVRGHVTQDVVAVLGDIVVEPGGRVDGDTIVVGGSVRTPGLPTAAPSPVAPAAGWLRAAASYLASVFSIAGAGVLTLAVAPQRVDRVASLIAARPVASVMVGSLGSLALVLAAALLAITLVGIPVSLLVLAALALSWLVGVVGLCQWIGDLLPLAPPRGRWLMLASCCLVMASWSWLPWPAVLLTVLGSMLGTGAALMSRVGAATS